MNSDPSSRISPTKKEIHKTDGLRYTSSLKACNTTREKQPSEMAERTLIIIKPDGIQRHLVGQIISRFETKGLKLVAAKFMQIPEQLA